MSWIVQKGSKGEVFHGTTFPNFERAKNAVKMAFPERRFKEDEKDALVWRCIEWGTVFRFVELKEIQEKPVLTVDELLVDQKQQLENLFKKHATTYRITGVTDDDLLVGQRVEEYRWGALINDILQFFKQPLGVIKINSDAFTEQEKEDFIKQWKQYTTNNSLNFVVPFNKYDYEYLQKLRADGNQVFINEVSIDEQLFGAGGLTMQFELAYVNHSLNVYHFVTSK